jgi:hypothetical protein
VGQVGLTVPIERRGHTNADAVGVSEKGEVSRRLELAAGDHLSDPFGRDVLHVALAAGKGTHLNRVDVESQYFIPCVDEMLHQRQANIT